MKRLLRIVVLAGLATAVAKAVKAMRRDQDPLPAPASAPTGGPWPPLRDEPATPAAPAPVAPTPAPASPAEPVPADETPTKVFPEPDGVPVAETVEPVVPPAPEPKAPPVPKAAPKPKKATKRTRPLKAPWAEPTADGECPEGYPIKAKLKSKIFHSPGQLNYDRTTPDRCYLDAPAAEADGLRAAKR